MLPHIQCFFFLIDSCTTKRHYPFCGLLLPHFLTRYRCTYVPLSLVVVSGANDGTHTRTQKAKWNENVVCVPVLTIALDRRENIGLYSFCHTTSLPPHSLHLPLLRLECVCGSSVTFSPFSSWGFFAPRVAPSAHCPPVSR